MGAACPKPSQSQEVGRWQISLRQILAATTAVATVLGLAAWGGWVQSDAVAYLSIAVVAAVFSSAARRVLLGGCVILGAFLLVMGLGDIVFGWGGRGPADGDLRSFLILAGLLTASAMILRLHTKAGAFSLTASLVLSEVFTAIVIVYVACCPTLFEAFDSKYRTYVLQDLRGYLFHVHQCLIVAPWLTGIALGELLARHKKAGDR